jgi:hypothetical protein
MRRRHIRWQVSDGFRPRWPKLADLMDASEHDVLAYMGFPLQHGSNSLPFSGSG